MFIESVFEYNESYTFRNWKFVNYKVNFVKMHYCIKGSAKYIDADHNIDYQPNHIYFLPVNTVHTLYDEPDDRLYHFYLHFFCIPPLKTLIDIDCNSNNLAYDLIQLLRKYAKQGKSNKQITQIVDCLFNCVFSDSASNNSLAYKIQNEIDNSFLKSDIHSILQSFNYSAIYLTRLFKKVYQQTPLEYYRNKRFDYAIQMMKNQKSLSDIVDALNYSSNENFSRDFKKKFGISPIKYKKQLLEKNI